MGAADRDIGNTGDLRKPIKLLHMHFSQYISLISSCIFKTYKCKFSFLRIFCTFCTLVFLFSAFHLCCSLFLINLTLYTTYCWLCDRFVMFLYSSMLMHQSWRGPFVEEYLQGTMNHLICRCKYRCVSIS